MSVLPQIPGYRLIRKLGQGGMADVYLGVQETLQREVAIKVLAPHFFRDEQFALRFVKEARTAAQMTHPNIITVHDVGRVQDTYFIVMEYLQESLHDRLKKSGGALNPTEALSILRMVAAALDYAHRKGFIHRDIKPDNIMFRADGAAVLVDFGIARAVDSTTQLTQTGMSIGTPHYMSPEQCRGEKIDGRSDIYSLGVQLYEILTGNVPYRAENTAGIILKHIQEPPPVLPSHLSLFQPLIERTMAKERETRLQTAGELIQMIDSFVMGQPAATQLIPDTLTSSTIRYTTPANGVAWPQSSIPTSPSVPVSPSRTPRPSSVGSISGASAGAAASSSSPATPSQPSAPTAVPRPKWPLAVLAASVAVLAVAILIILNSGGDNGEKIPDNDSALNNGLSSAPHQPGNNTSNPLDNIQITHRPSDKPDEKPTDSSSPSTVEKKPDTAPADANKPELKPSGAGSAEPAHGKPTVKPVKTEPDIASPNPPDESKPTYTGKTIANANIPSVTLLQIDPELRKEYNKQMEHITFQLPARLPVGAILQVKGQVILQTGISPRGKIEITDADATGLSVSPPRAKIRFMEILREKMNKTFVAPPTDKDGNSVRLSNWRVTFKVGKFNDKIILTKQ